MRIRGEWSAALDEFELASQRYRQVGSPDASGPAACGAGLGVGNVRHRVNLM